MFYAGLRVSPFKAHTNTVTKPNVDHVLLSAIRMLDVDVGVAFSDAV